MTNKDIYRFINSKDIRKHLEEIGYSFSSVEAAWLVYQSHDATMTEKLSAWRDIVATMPDQPVENSFHFDPYESLHKLLVSYVSVMESTICEMKVGGADIIYQYSLVYNDGYNGNYMDSKMYSTYTSCFKDMKEELSEGDECLLYGRIRRIKVDSCSWIIADYDRNGELTYISFLPDYCDEEDLSEFFDGLWFHFPVPYKIGDILYDPFHSSRGSYAGPVVMTGITPLKYAEDGRVHADSSDMNVWGYFQDADNGTIYHETTWNYMDFEYYPVENLTGKRRILKSLSNYIKEDISLDLLLRAYHIIMLEETGKDLIPKSWYTYEGMKLAGILPDENT